MTSPDLAYYNSPHTASRIVEYCGGSRGDAASCTSRFLVADSEVTFGLGIPQADDIMDPSRLGAILDRGLDVFRSVWDVRSLIALLDLDYQNPDMPDEAILNPSRSFSLMEPVFRAVEAELRHFGMNHIAVMTGQGYHLAWRIPAHTRIMAQLQRLAKPPRTLESKYEHDHPFTPEATPLASGRGHSGIGLLMEYLCHRVLRQAYVASELPVVLTGLAVGSRRKGREAISIDLSAYGDPLYMRYTRCAFSLYRKTRGSNGFLACLPRTDSPLEDLLSVRVSPDLAADYA
ncbi:MAG: hypothetical protein HYY32_01820, partial [Chloroflexi bacterium]|nr:hypothetical protein [Chloroflexota bacterium]